jgi:hypothetical protein
MESEKEAKEAIELIHGLPPLLKTSLGNAFFESNVLQKVDDMRSWCDAYLNDLRATLHSTPLSLSPLTFSPFDHHQIRRTRS